MTPVQNGSHLVNGQAKIKAQHLQRQACIYLRQSTPGQVAHHQESQVNQRRMADRAAALGWPMAYIQIIETDLGLSGQSSVERTGFQDLLNRVSLGQVGIVFSYEVSRLTRNNSDWYRLLEAASVFDTLIADFDGIYDLHEFNDRLLLGLKGTMSEAELHLIRLRLEAGRARQIERGDYHQGLPTGFLRQADGIVVKDPDRQVQHAIELVLTTFGQVGSCPKVLAYLREHDLRLPRRQAWGPERGQVVWKAPTHSAIYAMVTNPAYAGTFVYGRRPVAAPGVLSETTAAHSRRVFKALEDWPVIHHKVYPAYISWETYLANQEKLRGNRPRFSTPNAKAQGASRQGTALLQGLVVCGQCGHRLQTIYKPAPHYVCQALARRFDQAACLFLDATPLDQLIVEAFFQALQPAQLDALDALLKDQAAERTRLEQQWTEQLKRAQYEAQLAARQYQAVDPDNRLVTAELERRWEAKLSHLREVEASVSHFQQTVPVLSLPDGLAEQFRHVAQNLPDLWPQLTNDHKKDLLRSPIASVILTRSAADALQVKIVWVSGHFSPLHLRLSPASNAKLPGYEQMLARLHDLWQQHYSDAEIARQLTAEGFHSARSATLSPTTVKAFRLQQAWYRPASHPVASAPGYVKISELATRWSVSAQWIYRRVRNGQIPAQYVIHHPTNHAILIRDDPAAFQLLRLST